MFRKPKSGLLNIRDMSRNGFVVHKGFNFPTTEIESSLGKRNISFSLKLTQPRTHYLTKLTHFLSNEVEVEIFSESLKGRNAITIPAHLRISLHRYDTRSQATLINHRGGDIQELVLPKKYKRVE